MESRDIHKEEWPRPEPCEKFRGAGVYADLLLDVTFKKAFNPDSPNKACLIELLNAVLDGELESPVTDVHSRDKEIRSGSNENRTSIFDLYCIDQLRRRFVVEVQIARQANILKRAVFYTSQAIAAQGARGRNFGYDFDPVLTVVLMDFRAFDDDSYIRHVKPHDSSGTKLPLLFHYTFVELPKFRKALGELASPLDRGLFALKNIQKLSEMPGSYAGTPFELLFSESKLSRLTKEEQKMIDMEQMRKWDEYAIRSYAIKSGREEGLAEGRAEGLVKGREEGRAEGRAEGLVKGREEGREEASCEIAKAFLAKGIPLDVVSSATGISMAELQKLM